MNNVFFFFLSSSAVSVVCLSVDLVGELLHTVSLTGTSKVILNLIKFLLGHFKFRNRLKTRTTKLSTDRSNKQKRTYELLCTVQVCKECKGIDNEWVM